MIDSNGKISVEEQFYIDLLELFAKDLNQRGVNLITISVNGQLNEFPNIKKKVADLQSKGWLHYYEIIPWFKNVTDYGSPEGHSWGKKAHVILGTNLTDIILKNYN